MLSDVEHYAPEQHLDELAQRLFTTSNRAFVPFYPWCFVRVLEKEQQKNGIILPDIEHNKTIHEGIVLAVWKPFWKEKYKVKDGNQYHERQHISSSLKPGDHVLFHHFAGVPIHGFTRERYRVVKELDWDYTKDGGIFATVPYGPKETRPIEKLQKLISEHVGYTAPMMAAIEQKFLLIDRDQQSVTLSGR